MRARPPAAYHGDGCTPVGSADAPLRIGSGSNDHFYGRLSDVRLYGRMLLQDEIRHLAKLRP